MGRGGPPKKPTSLKLLQGLPGGAHKLNRDEPKPRKASPIELRCPPELSEEGKKVWKKYAPRLYRLGLLTELDLQSFRRYCDLQGAYTEARRDIAANGSYIDVFATPTKDEAKRGDPLRLARRVLSPAAAALPGIRTELLRLEREFGMTPASRAGIEVSPAMTEAADAVEERLFGIKG